MVLGFMLADLKKQVIGVSVFAKSSEEMESTAFDICRRAVDRLHLPADFISRDEIKVDVRYHAGAYGEYNQKILEAVKLVAETEGIVLDLVYTGKAMSGLIDWIRHDGDELQWTKTALFVHTGGQNAISAYPSFH